MSNKSRAHFYTPFAVLRVVLQHDQKNPPYENIIGMINCFTVNRLSSRFFLRIFSISSGHNRGNIALKEELT